MWQQQSQGNRLKIMEISLNRVCVKQQGRGIYLSQKRENDLPFTLKSLPLVVSEIFFNTRRDFSYL